MTSLTQEVTRLKAGKRHQSAPMSSMTSVSGPDNLISFRQLAAAASCSVSACVLYRWASALEPLDAQGDLQNKSAAKLTHWTRGDPQNKNVQK